MIRPFVAADWPAVWALFQSVAAAGDAFAYDESTTEQTARKLWADPPATAFVAVIDGRFAGTYFVRPNQPGRGDHVANAGYMVHPSARGRGLSVALCEHSLEAARRLGYAAIQFNCVVASNTAAVRAWERCGFVVVGRVPGAYRHAVRGRVDVLILYRSLETAMATTPEVKLHDLLKEFGVAMLVTRTADGQLRGRPMALAEAEPDGAVWFATDRDSGKVDELARDPHAAVTMQSGSKFVSLSGTATPVDDRARVRRLWKAEWKVWFPGGADDPNLLLLKVDGHSGEYWDNSGVSGIKYLIEAGRALLSGSRPDVGGDPKVHAKVSL